MIEDNPYDSLWKITEHTLYICPGNHDDGGWTCMFCSGGLSACSVCGAFEGAWPDECPGEKMSYEVSNAVYKGELNFRFNAWHAECCKVMRHLHDTDNYMAEHGYYKNDDGKWEKRE